jgi:hypothetical protein
MSYKNIRKIKKFSDKENITFNDDIFLLSNDNYLNLYNIYNIDDLYNFIITFKKNNTIANDIKLNILYLIFDCWIINNIKILKNHNSYFIDLCNLYLEYYNMKFLSFIKTNKNYSKLKTYISKFIKYWISLDNNIPLINNKFFLPELILYLEKLYNI